MGAARPDFSGASLLERPFTAVLERLDDETLLLVRDKIGLAPDKLLLALCIAMLVADTVMGRVTHPLFVAITFVGWYTCALGATCRAWWPAEDGKAMAPEHAVEAHGDGRCVIADVDLLSEDFRPGFVVWANNHGYDLDAADGGCVLAAGRADDYRSVAHSFQDFLEEAAELPVPPDAWSARLYWYTADDETSAGPDLGASLFARIIGGEVVQVRVNRDGFGDGGIAVGAKVPCAEADACDGRKW